MTQALQDRLRDLLGLTKGAGSDGAQAHETPKAAAFLMPHGQGPHPAVLYCHAHGGDYALGRRELTKGARWLSAPYAQDLRAAGFAVLCADMPGFGDRQAEGRESALAKAGLWQGRPLFGQMVAAQLAALDLLLRDARIDPTRIVTLGVSMGAALAMWVAALNQRVCACVQLCMLANIAPLIALGAHDRHGPYLTVPGLLRVADIGRIAGLIAPRPQFVGLGADDCFTPPAARDPALVQLRGAYGATSKLQISISTGTGHMETPEMRASVLRFLTSATASKDKGKTAT